MSPVLLTAATALTLAFNSCITLAVFAVPLMAVYSEYLADSRKAGFYRKFAQHVSRAGLVLLGYVVLMMASAALMAGDHLKSVWPLWKAQPRLPVVAGTMWAGLVLLLPVYDATWKSWKDKRELHKSVGLAAAFAGMGALIATGLLIGWSFLAASEDGASMRWGDLVLSVSSGQAWPILSLLALGVASAPACAGIASTVYMLLRRSRDDWGRDYYAFGMRHGALWTALFLAISSALSLWTAYVQSQEVNDGTSSVHLVVWGMPALLAVAATLFGTAGRSETPLRHKATIAAGAIALLLAMSALCIALIS